MSVYQLWWRQRKYRWLPWPKKWVLLGYGNHPAAVSMHHKMGGKVVGPFETYEDAHVS